MGRRAIFLDRDGTLVHPRHYPSRPEELIIYDGIEAELRRLQAAGFCLLVITNQAGLARGYFDQAALQRMHDWLGAELARHDVRIDGFYFCPHHPDGVVPELRQRCGCRKPQPGMLLQAAAEHCIDLEQSWFVGDILDDVEAGNRAGCRTILVDLATESPPTRRLRRPAAVARDTVHALRIIAAEEGLVPQAEQAYLPASWRNQHPEHGTQSTAQSTHNTQWRAAQHILLVRLDNLGDVLVTSPAFHAVRESLPAAHLTLLASPVGAQAASLNPDLDDVIVYQSPQMDPWGKLPQDSEREQRLIALLKARRFDGAIIFTSFRQSALPAAYLCYLADIPLRAAASIDGSGSLLTTRHKHLEQMLHEVERGIDLVGVLGCVTSTRDLVLQVPPLARASVHRRLAASLNYNGPLVVLHPGCSMPARTYPWEQFAQVVELLITQLGATVALTGAENERALVDTIVRVLPPQCWPQIIPLAGELSFAEFCALIEAAELTVTNNTGPMHVAAAVKTPVVALFALTNPPEQWGPWQVPHRLLYHEVDCRLCYSRVCPYDHECLRLVAPTQVLEAAAELLRIPQVTA